MNSHGGRRDGAGRKPGVPNKIGADLRAMILGALDGVGGVEYLQRQAEKSPGAFLALVGKVLPTQIAGAAPDGAIHVRYTWAKPEPPPATADEPEPTTDQ
jgi:hypothetical protein